MWSQDLQDTVYVLFEVRRGNEFCHAETHISSPKERLCELEITMLLRFSSPEVWDNDKLSWSRVVEGGLLTHLYSFW